VSHRKWVLTGQRTTAGQHTRKHIAFAVDSLMAEAQEIRENTFCVLYRMVSQWFIKRGGIIWDIVARISVGEGFGTGLSTPCSIINDSQVIWRVLLICIQLKRSWRKPKKTSTRNGKRHHR